MKAVEKGLEVADEVQNPLLELGPVSEFRCSQFPLVASAHIGLRSQSLGKPILCREICGYSAKSRRNRSPQVLPGAILRRQWRLMASAEKIRPPWRTMGLCHSGYLLALGILGL